MEDEAQGSDEIAPLPSKRYILTKPEHMQQYLEDRKRRYPSRANIERRKKEHLEKQRARVLADPTQPNHFMRCYQQYVRANRIVLVRKQHASITDRLIYDQQRYQASMVLEALQFITEQNYLQGPIPQEFLQNYELRPFEITFEAPKRAARTSSDSETSESSDS